MSNDHPPRTLYALFVGIDAYQPPVRPLRGCVNDVTRLEAMLRERTQGEHAQLQFKPLLLANEAATRPAIIKAFREHLGKAGKEDVALFCYSGHGSQEPAPPEFWHLEPDKLNETLVCYDSRADGGWDLADKELSYLIAEVAKNGAHVAVILDSCHSGSGTRDALDDEAAGVRVRLQPGDQRQRPLDSYIVTQAEAGLLQAGAPSQGGPWLALPQGRHILIAACTDDETAKETMIDGEQRGVFSYYLQDTLQSASEILTYRDLFKRISALVPTKVSRQTPVLEASDAEEVLRPFLGGAIVQRPPSFTLRHDPARGWLIDGGAVHGIAAPAGDEFTVLSLFPFDARLEDLRTVGDAIGQAQVTHAGATQSEVKVTPREGGSFDPKTTYKAVVVAQPLTPLVVAFEGDAGALQQLRQALAAAGPDGKPSLLVREGPLTEADYGVSTATVHSDKGDKEVFRIGRKADAYPLAVDTEGLDQAGAALTVQRLEHIARWQKIAELANKTTAIAADDILVEFFQVVQADGEEQLQPIDATQGLRFAYRPPFGERDNPYFRVRLTNQGKRDYYCMLLVLSQDYSIFTDLLPEGVVRLKAGEAIWGTLKNREGNRHPSIPVTVPPAFFKQGVTQLRDLIKLIVSTEKGDATLLAQDALPVTVTRGGTPKGSGEMSTLNRLMARVNTRAMHAFPEDEEPYSDWRTLEFTSTIVRPRPGQALTSAGEPIALADGVTLARHPSLRAQVRLGSTDLASRDTGGMLAPALFRDNPAQCQPLEFTASRGGGPGLTVLEMNEVEDHTVVTPDAPLVLTLPSALAAHEHLLPYAYDGEFFLPLGFARSHDGRTEIRLEHLPTPISAGERDLKGSIKIMFQKIAADKVGIEYDYPQLAAAAIAGDGNVTYTSTPAQVRQQVAAAARIVLYVHGLFGDTRGMVASAATSGLAEQYDLILAFDYESINTPIEETARALKQRLQDVGLGPNHGKTVHLIAHSLGGLVARWFIEVEGGNQMVQHLVTLGTPHKGTPWPKIHDWATTLLVLGLNTLTTVAWPLRIATTLIKAVEVVDVTADQLASNSPFIKQLAGNTDPGIRITALSGNTSILPAATQPQTGEAASRLEQLLSRLEQMKLLEKAAGLAFFGQPNDIAVSVSSALGLPAGHSLVTPVEIACDHMSFFDTAESLSKLVEALRA